MALCDLLKRNRNGCQPVTGNDVWSLCWHGLLPDINGRRCRLFILGKSIVELDPGDCGVLMPSVGWFVIESLLMDNSK